MSSFQKFNCNVLLCNQSYKRLMQCCVKNEARGPKIVSQISKF